MIKMENPKVLNEKILALPTPTTHRITENTIHNSNTPTMITTEEPKKLLSPILAGTRKRKQQFSS
jgi:hypothetical protein